MDSDDMPVNVLTQIIEALELHNKALADQRKFIEILLQENVEIKSRLSQLEGPDSLDSSDKKFLADITTRLAAISSAIDAKS